jgi:DNA uptake protein ComE-like DNA-binding protein
MNSAAGQAESAALVDSRPARRGFRWAGSWYFVVVVATVGMFAWVPFLHAALRLETVKARLLLALFVGLDLLLYVLFAVAPKDGQGHTVDGVISAVGGMLLVGIVIAGCILLASLRRMVYDGMPVDIAPAKQHPAVDPAIQAVLAGRARRDEARKLAAEDPLLAHELRIGRPDVTKDYDDGGLVDLNHATADVIAETCGIPVDTAAIIVRARDLRGEPFANVDELFVMAELPVATWDGIRDRAVLLP